MTRPKLLLPGPIDIWEETLEALSRQVLPHYGDDFNPIWLETVSMVKEIFQTENDVIIMTAPGSGALDAAVASLFEPQDKVFAVNNGPFAGRLIEILNAYKCEVIPIDGEWGLPGDVDKMRQALHHHTNVAGIAVVANDTGVGVRNPVEAYAELAREFDLPIFVDGVSAMGGYDIPVDKWGLDIAVTSSNKALETAPGLGIISVSDRAWDIINSKNKAHRGWYYDLGRWKQLIDQSPTNPYPTTQATSLIVSLHASLKRIMEKETLKGHWARYAWAQAAVRTGLRALACHPVVADDAASYTVTTFRIHEDMRSVGEFRDYLIEHHGIMVATAMGSFENRILRAGHMGKAGSQEYIEPFLLGVEDFLRTVYKKDIPQGLSLEGIRSFTQEPG
jgi:aspartate aminotransferase-like enzyme